jgi:hypothetical protein
MWLQRSINDAVSSIAQLLNNNQISCTGLHVFRFVHSDSFHLAKTTPCNHDTVCGSAKISTEHLTVTVRIIWSSCAKQMVVSKKWFNVTVSLRG